MAASLTLRGVLAVFLLGACAVPGLATAQKVNCEDGSVRHPILPDGFIDGDYALIGRHPGGSPAFEGQARIKSDGCAVTVERRIGDATSVIRGGWQRLDLPDGAYALEFRSDDGAALWSCQVSVDLDNYARLTCFRILTNAAGGAPGLEAMFPTATWPDSMPGKTFE